MQKHLHVSVLCLSVFLIGSTATLNAQNTSTSTTTTTTTTTEQAPLKFSSSPELLLPYKDAYNYSISASGGNGNYTFSAVTELPSWLTLSQGGGAALQLNNSIISNPMATAIDANGNVYVIGTNHYVYKITPDGTTTVVFNLTGNPDFNGGWYSSAVIIGNYLYYAETMANPGIKRVDITQSSPHVTSVLTGYGFRDLQYYDGELYASSSDYGGVIKIDQNNFTFTHIVTNDYDIANFTFTKTGELIWSRGESSGLYKWDGDAIAYITNTGGYTQDLATAPDGSIFVSYYGKKIRKYTSDLSSYIEATPDEMYTTNMSITPQGKVIFSDLSLSAVYAIGGGASLTGNPKRGDMGKHTIKLKVNDGDHTDIQEFTLKVIDTYSPEVEAYSPAKLATGVALNTDLKITFDEKVKAGEGKITISKLNEQTVLEEIDITSDKVTFDGNEVIIKLNNLLPQLTEINVEIPESVIMDSSNNYYTGINSVVTVNQPQQPNNPQQPFPFFYNDPYSENNYPINFPVLPTIPTVPTVPTTTTTTTTVSERGWTFKTMEHPKSNQTITFAEKDTVVYGSNDYVPAATASSALAVTFSTSDESIAYITNGKLHIKRVGTVELTAHQEGNYDYNAAEPVTQLLTVAPKEVTAFIISDMTIQKNYDGDANIDLNEGGMYLDGAIDQQVWVTGKTKFDNKNAGTNKTVTASEFELHGNAAGNYTIKNLTSTAKGTIAPREVNVYLLEGVKFEKNYDGNRTLAVAKEKLFVEDVFENDEVTATATATFDTKNAGDEKTVTVDNFILAGADKGNYKIITDSRESWGKINPVFLTITADNKTKKQGAENPALTFTYAGFVGGDNVNDLEEMPHAVTTASAKSPIGTYEIAAEGAESNNYIITHIGGKLTVIPSGNTHIKTWSDNSNVHVRIYSEVAQKSSIILYTEVGQPVIVQPKQLQAGINTVSIPITPLARGFYVLNVSADKFRESERVKVK